MRKIFSLVFSFLLISQPSYAFTCDKDFAISTSIERNFIGADIVFLGTMQSIEDNKITISVNELFKSPPDKKFMSPTLEAYSVWGAPLPRSVGTEWIFYGGIDDRGRILLSPCTASHITPEKVVEEIRKQNKKFEGWDTIFIGKVAGATHQLVEQRGKRKAYTKSKINFSISSVLRNADGDPFLAAGKEITIKTSLCGEKYRLGQEYIVFAESSRETVIENGQTIRKPMYMMDCMWEVYNLHEEDVLRSLKKK